MNKTERMVYMQKRFPQLEETMSDAVIPISKREIRETVEDLDAFREYQRDQVSGSEALTSDEK